MSQHQDRGLSTLKIIQTLEGQIAQLREALNIVPAALLLQAGEPYRLQFTRDELRQIQAALEIETAS